MTRITIHQAMQIAIGHHQAGRLAEAEPIYRQVLDPFPYNGHSSTFDQILKCSYIIKIYDLIVFYDDCASILYNVRFTEMIARSPDQYVDIAVALAGDPVRLVGLRAELRQRMQASPLMDGPRYAADVALALRPMWLTWCGS